MRVACLSASNVKHARKTSTSLRVCRLVAGHLSSLSSEVAVEIRARALVDYELAPCIGCGACYSSGSCAHDTDINRLYTRLAAADGLFIVSAHYAPIPAKLSMLLEKVEQLAFLRRFNDAEYRSPLFRKPVAIIAHGGGTETALKSYEGTVLDVIANALSWPVEMEIVGVDRDHPNGVAFPVKQVTRDLSTPFPVQEYDWADVEARIRPLVDSFYQRLTDL